MTDIPTGPQPSLGMGEEEEWRFALVPHPDFPSRAITSISVGVRRDANEGIQLTYRIAGAIQDVLWPIAKTSQPAGPTDGLWEHTVFEAFVTHPEQQGYIELNIATSTRWALYRFDDYRTGMTSIGSAPDATIKFGEDCLDVWVSDFSPYDFPDEIQLGLSAIIEAKDGTKSYWALAHAPGPPDFHNRDCFTARLAAPSGA